MKNKNKYKQLTFAPFCYSTPSISSSSWMVLFLLLPQIVMLFITKSYVAVGQIVISILSAIAADLIYSLIVKKSLVPSITVILQGMLIGFFIPEGYPIFLLINVVLFSLLLTYYLFGGFAQSWINPVAITVIFLYLLGTQYFPGFTLNASHLQSPNVGQQLVNDGFIQKIPADGNITNFLNAKVFKFAGVSLPEGYVSLFWDTGALIPAFRFNLLTLIATMILLAFGGIKWIIPCVFLFIYGLLVRIFGLFPYGGILNQGDILLAIFSSGTIMTAFLLLQWPGTTPMTIVGKVVFGVFSGVFAFLIMGCGTSPIGAMFVILITNIISPIIQLVEDLIYQKILRVKGNKDDREN